MLPQIVGLANATEMLMLGTPVDAAEAARVGLATKVVAPEELEDGGGVIGTAVGRRSGPRTGNLEGSLRRGMRSTFDAE